MDHFVPLRAYDRMRTGAARAQRLLLCATWRSARASLRGTSTLHRPTLDALEAIIVTTEPVLETLVLDVSRDGLFHALRAQFTSSTTFLPELLQNARRAGASRVLLEWDADRNVFIVTDDGCGIRNFRHVVVAYRSGWNSDIKRRENPFGVGLFAALFASDEVIVHSLDRRMVLDERCLASGAIHVTAAPSRQGTEVQLVLKEPLRRSAEDWLKLLTDLVKGFPIPVHFNGTPIARPDALDSGLLFRETDIGALHLFGWEECQPRTTVLLPILYCQGLPLRRIRHTIHTGDVLHVDTMRFAARVPDRDVFLNPEESEAAIVRGIEAQWQARLRLRQTELRPLEFAERYWQMCVAFQVPELLVGMPVAASMLSRYVAPEEAIDCGDEPLEAWGEGALPQDSTPLVEYFRGGYTGCEDDPPAPLASIYVMARELAVLTLGVPKSHPCWQRAVDLLDESLGLEYELNEPGEAREFFGDWIICQVQTCESYAIRFRPTQACTIPESLRSYLMEVTIRTYSFFDSKRQRIIVPAGDRRPGRAARQVSTFCDEFDHFQAGAYEADREAIERIVASLRAKSPAAYLHALLAKVTPDPAALGGQAFQVKYDVHGHGWNVHSV